MRPPTTTRTRGPCHGPFGCERPVFEAGCADTSHVSVDRQRRKYLLATRAIQVIDTVRDPRPRVLSVSRRVAEAAAIPGPSTPSPLASGLG